MIRLAGIVISIGLADSLNPTTIAPALYLASGERPREHITRFMLGVFLVYLVGGAAIALGPGQLVLSLIPRPDAAGRQGLEVGVGVVLLIVGGLVWRNRQALSDREVPKFVRQPQARSSTLLGATIMAVELPTAFPYFAAIAAIVGSGVGVIQQLFLLLLFNICFVLPILCILGTLWVAPDHAQERLSRARLFLHRHWPQLLGGLMLLVGVLVVLMGATGLAGHAHGRVARFFRHVHKLLKP
ncbi:MAG TPA: GAP family protein [Solirubrobacteraceae bacterium]|jgi:cytochrome c biogenesis protein CcdA|nr:GAP family protein [Solirubrobacteraceae bacterium]